MTPPKKWITVTEITISGSEASAQVAGSLAETNVAAEIGDRVSAPQLLIWGILATASMLFAGFASAYLVRREGADWQPVTLPRILWFNSAVLLLSSVTVELARSAWHKGRFAVSTQWVRSSSALGVVFLAGQLVAWKQLVAQGVYLPTNPYSSFFYVLTALHGLHLLGGIAGLGYLLWRVSNASRRPVDSSVLDSCATYWHFVDGVWVLLYLLLLFY